LKQVYIIISQYHYTFRFAKEHHQDIKQTNIIYTSAVYKVTNLFHAVLRF